MVLENVNDNEDDFSKLVYLFSNFKYKEKMYIKFSTLNEINNINTNSRVEEVLSPIMKELLKVGVTSYLFNSKGVDINGCCGTLRRTEISEYCHG